MLSQSWNFVLVASQEALTILLNGAEWHVPMPLPLQRERHDQLHLPSKGISISANLCTGTAPTDRTSTEGHACINFTHQSWTTLRCQQTVDKQCQMG